MLKNKWVRKIGLGAATLVVVVAGAASFSAFEAHVINVTARIENALFVPTDAIDFGTVFPQEYLTADIEVSLSDSFLGENRVDDVEYVIKQKPKVKAFVAEGDPNSNPTPGNPYATIFPEGFENGIKAWRYCEENLPVNAPYELTPADLNGEYFRYCYLPLANYLSKHEVTADGTEEENDVSVDAFHAAYFWDDEGKSFLNPDFIASGRLAKSVEDVSDTWTIDLMVPCFVNHCAQEADDETNLVGDDIPGFYVPEEYRLPAHLEHLVFGTDLWIEVTEISLPPNGQVTTLTVKKNVVNNFGGNNTADDFVLTINGLPYAQNVPHALAPGVYTVSEIGLIGYQASFGGACDANGQVTLNPGDNKTCVVHNRDIPANITLFKEVVNNNGGTAIPTQFTMRVNGNIVPHSGSIAVNSNANNVITEDPFSGYAFVSITGAGCPANLGDPFVLNEGQAIFCTITNDDIAPL